MKKRLFAGVIAAAFVCAAASAQQSAWKAPRTVWGDPDISGLFTTDDELGVPFERPPQFGDRRVVTEQEYDQRLTQSERQDEADREEFVAPRQAQGEGAGGTGPPSHWLERGKPSRRTSIVIDPPDGRIPFLNDEARRRGAIAAMRTPEGIVFNGPEDLDKYDRCITRGFPHVIFPTIYDNTSQIVQGPGWVSIRYEMIHDARVIPLDDLARRPHFSPKIRSYFGDSRGRWDGDTLVVDVTNFSAKAGYRGATTNLHVIERFTRTGTNTVHYELTVDDPTTFSRPWTAALDLKKDPRQAQVPEYACHEGNYAMFNILSGARAAETSKNSEVRTKN
ncbi:MAG TPA: hypothetical protein VLV86_03520 [Vicinamibacterales bacterium]|nr:hypothetical protein [Vicinamibacterales bacterium]